MIITANGGTVAGAEAALVAGLTSGMAYLNIHTTRFPGGEIRTFLQELPPAVAPSLSSVGLLLLITLLMLAGARAMWRRG